MKSSFSHLCLALVNACVLTVPSPTDVFVLHFDASLCGLGLVLNVVRSGEECPVAYYARQLREPQQSYSAMELEAMASVSNVQHFSCYFYGREFTLVTDYKALESLLTSKTLNRPGPENGNADALSRQEWEEQELRRSRGNLSGGGCRGDIPSGELSH